MARINANERPQRSNETHRQDHAPACAAPRRRRRRHRGRPRAGLERIVVANPQAAQGAKIAALDDIIAKAGDPADAKQLRAILEGASPDDAEALRRELFEGSDAGSAASCKPDEELQVDWRKRRLPVQEPDVSPELRGAEIPAAGRAA